MANMHTHTLKMKNVHFFYQQVRRSLEHLFEVLPCINYVSENNFKLDLNIREIYLGLRWSYFEDIASDTKKEKHTRDDT